MCVYVVCVCVVCACVCVCVHSSEGGGVSGSCFGYCVHG